MAQVDNRMDYPQMEAMVASFKKASQGLQESIAAIQGMAGKLEGGLQGTAGSQLQEALKKMLVNKMAMLVAKSEEMAKDLKEAVEVTKSGVKNSKSKYA